MAIETFQGTVTASRALYIRRVPTASGSVPIGGLAYGWKVAADRKQDGLWHMTRRNGARRHLPVDT